MNKIKILLLQKNTNIVPYIEEYLLSMECVLLKESSIKNIDTKIVSNSLDLIIFDTDIIKEENENAIGIFFDILTKQKIQTILLSDSTYLSELETQLKQMNIIDCITKPIINLIVKNKLSLYLQTIIQKKKTDYLFNEYDKNVIASKTDKKGLITYASNAFCEICGYTKEELIGKPHNIIRHSDMPKELFKNLWQTIKSKQQWTGDIKNLNKDGSFYWVEVVISPELDYKGEIIGYSAIRHDISSKKYIEEILVIDYLTKLYNRRYYDEILEKEIYRAKRYKHSLSLLILDIDHFKSINDTYGHDAGDIVLKEFSKLLINNIRISDIASRIGGEEFTIIVPNDKREETFLFAQKIRKLVENHHFSKVGKITVSIGISSYEVEDTPQILFVKADKALYSSKQNGRNRVSLT